MGESTSQKATVADRNMFLSATGQKRVSVPQSHFDTKHCPACVAHASTITLSQTSPHSASKIMPRTSKSGSRPTAPKLIPTSCKIVNFLHKHHQTLPRTCQTYPLHCMSVLTKSRQKRVSVCRSPKLKTDIIQL